MTYTIRPSVPADLPQMQQIFADGREKMIATGNLKQWLPTYPSDEMLLGDMQQGFSYVVEHEGTIVGTFMLATGIEPTYINIYEGQWLDDIKPYATIHRIASRHGAHGVAKAVVEWCFSRIDNIRIDTHRDNKVMQHIVTSLGFAYCGIIYLEDGDERLAYQRIIK